MDRSALLPVLLLGVLEGCAVTPAVRTRPEASSPTAIDARAKVEATDPWVLDVTMTLVGGARAVTGDALSAITSLEVEDALGRRAPPRDARSIPVRCAATCEIRYRVDLTKAAVMAGDDIAVATRSGPDLLAPATTWLLRPEPLIPHVPVRIAVDPGPGRGFLAGFHRTTDDLHFEIASEGLLAAGYTAFGAFASLSVPVTEGRVDVAVLGGARAVPLSTLGRWVSTMAGAVESLYGRFPVSRAAVFVLPQEGGRDVDDGRTLPAGGASTLIVLGARAGEQALHDDWILAHEFIHLGVPSFYREGRWLDEGLATYYEPVLRARAGLRSDASLWSEFADQMPRGVASRGDPSLPRTTDHDRIYWGGATFALAADVLIRARTRGAYSLDDGLRAVLQKGGDATRIWSVASFLRAVDEAVGVRATEELYALADRGASCPAEAPLPMLLSACVPETAEQLTGFLQELGVERKTHGEVALRDDATLSMIRRQIDRRAGAGGVGIAGPTR